MRIKGWMGRADQTTKVRGMFVHPGQVAGVLKRHPEVGKVRLVVSGNVGSDVMVLKAELDHPSQDALARIADSVRELTKLRADIEPVEPGSLPNEGKVINDIRSYADRKCVMLGKIGSVRVVLGGGRIRQNNKK